MRWISFTATLANVERNSWSSARSGRSSAKVLMATSGFRISWAMPVAMAPSAESRSARRLSSSSAFRREWSFSTAIAPLTSPWWSWSAEVWTISGSTRPSGWLMVTSVSASACSIEARPEDGPDRRVEDVERPAQDARRLDPEDALRGRVERRHDAVLAGGDDARVHAAEEALVVLLDRHDLVVELGVLEPDGELAGQRLQEVELVGEERVAGELGAGQDHGHQPPVAHGHRHLRAPRAQARAGRRSPRPRRAARRGGPGRARPSRPTAPG